MNCLVYLNWPESCFCATADDIRFLRTLLPRGARVTVARDEAAFLKALPQATHVITWHFLRAWFAIALKLKVLATPAAGRELVSADAPEGVTVHFGGFHGEIISESVLAFVLAWTHGFFQARHVPLWPRARLAELINRDLAGTCAVVLGYGRIGRAIGDRLSAYGVSVFGYSRHLGVAKSTFDRALKRADWLITALPSDTGTDNLVDAKMLAKLPSRCVFVNVGRGNCVDEAALLAALESKRLAGAYLDVFQDEPIAAMLSAANAGRTKRAAGLAARTAAECPWNLVRMPHASAFSPSYLKRSFQELKDEGLI